MTIDLATTLPHLPTNRFTSHHLPTNKKTSYHITSLHITSSPRKNDGKTTTNHQRERLKKTLVLGSAHEICLNYSYLKNHGAYTNLYIKSLQLYKSLYQLSFAQLVMVTGLERINLCICCTAVMTKSP